MKDVAAIQDRNFVLYLETEMLKHLGEERWENWSEGIFAAFHFASGAHAGQVRKGSGVRYIVHPIHVASILAKFSDWLTLEMLQAALLHDTIEDTPVTAEDIEYFFGHLVAQYVVGMTKVEVVGNRADRKAAERVRLSQEISEVQTIKAADIYSNTRSMEEDDPSFYPQYLAEQELLFMVLDLINIEVEIALSAMFARAAIKLGRYGRGS